MTTTTLTFAPGELTKTVSIDTIQDNTYEGNETLFVNLSNAAVATITDAQGLGTITDNADIPTITINDVSVAEGGTLVFTVTLSNPSTLPITVDYATADGTATDSLDYTGFGATTLTFAPGELTKTVSIDTIQDNTYEGNETLFVNLSGATVATITDAQGLGTITDNADIPTITINDISVAELPTSVFTVTLSNPSTLPITVDYATADGTATDSSDYTGMTTTTLTFAPGELTKTVSIDTIQDNTYEGNETLFVNLSNAAVATIADAQGLGTITDNADIPTITINDVSVAEGGTLVFTVTLSNPSTLSITVDYATADGTATDSLDYTGMTTTALTFAPGELTKTVSIDTIQDNTYEGNETLFVNLSNAAVATITDAQGLGTITDNADIPTITINDVSVAEGGTLVFTVTLSNPSTLPITVDYATADGTATDSLDYTGFGATTLTFAPGELTKTVSIDTIQDNTYEGNETLFVNLSGATVATITDAQGLGTITDNADIPTITINDISVAEDGTFVFTVTLSNPAPCRSPLIMPQLMAQQQTV